jgi:hypothetical protein
MARLYRPVAIGPHVPNDGKTIRKNGPTGRIRVASVAWWGQWRDSRGIQRRQRLSENKDVARQMLARLVS